ncbi:MAG: dephospho-CoA kinase, partial [Clostridia bacterium]|nr:dephospho-CoA kinase [Clostridia bacterium]
MILGLTGSMASGKSTVSAMLKEYGLYVLDADEEAHAVLELPAVRRELAELFGEDILDENGAVVRARLAEKAFASAEETAELNAVTHPAVIQTMLEKAEEFALEYPEIPVVFDVPLLFESGMDKLCDRVVTVAADDEVRYLRIMLRDGLTR